MLKSYITTVQYQTEKKLALIQCCYLILFNKSYSTFIMSFAQLGSHSLSSLFSLQKFSYQFLTCGSFESKLYSYFFQSRKVIILPYFFRIEEQVDKVFFKSFVAIIFQASSILIFGDKPVFFLKKNKVLIVYNLFYLVAFNIFSLSLVFRNQFYFLFIYLA